LGARKKHGSRGSQKQKSQNRRRESRRQYQAATGRQILNAARVRPDASLPTSSAAVVVPTPLARPGEWKERIIRTFAILSLAYALYYIVWRWTSTLNWDAWWFSVTLALAETIGLLTTFFFVFNTWKMKYHPARKPRPGISVDVFVTTYDEPLEVIRKTALGARDIRYPHRTYILDDGKRAELAAMCEELGIGYIRREGNENAKAGNLNHALKVTSGEVFLVFDADHVPLPHAVDRLLPYFEDPKVAFVQSPQVFYNTDSITTHVKEETRRLWTEQNLFFTVIEPCKDHWGAAFFCGSCAALRRTALEQIGGFSTRTITEDFETSVVLHGLGWKSAYCVETLAYGLTPNSVVGFHVQHLRWGQGTMQVWKHYNPLTYPGLTLGQRLCHFYSVLVYTDGVLNLVFYSAPLVYLLFGVLPINTLGTNFLGRWIPLYVAGRILSRLMARGTETPFWFNERNSMAKFWTHARAVTGYFAKKKLKFHVTPKGTGEVPVEAYRPQLVMMGLSAVAIVFGLVARWRGWVSYGAPGNDAVPFWLNIFWATWIFAMAAWVVHLSRSMQPKRADYRFPEVLPVRFRVLGGDAAALPDLGLTQDLNSAGLAFRATRALAPGDRVEFDLPLVGGPVTVAGPVLHSTPLNVRGVDLYVHGVAFDDLPLDLRDAIEIHCTQHAVPHARLVFRESVDMFDLARARFRNRRGERRHVVQLPVLVELDERGRGWERAEQLVGVLDDSSASGASLILAVPVVPGARIRFAMPGTPLSGEGVGLYTKPLETPVGVRYAVGVARVPEAAWPAAQSRWLPGERWMRKMAAMGRTAAGGEAVRKVAV
jgi:cellulose synthase (UDP-forming)